MKRSVIFEGKITNLAQVYKRTEKIDGKKTTYVFQRDIGSQPKTKKDKLLQKMSDLFSGEKKAKHSITLLKVAQEMQRKGIIDKDVNLFSENPKTKSLRLNTSVLINIANNKDLISTNETLGEIQGNEFNIYLSAPINN